MRSTGVPTRAQLSLVDFVKTKPLKGEIALFGYDGVPAIVEAARAG